MSIYKVLKKLTKYTLSFTIGPLIFLILTQSGKRLIVSSSLYAHLDNITIESDEVDKFYLYAKEVNEHLDVAGSSVKSLFFPILLQSTIWGNLDVEKLKKYRSLESAINYTLANTPWFLRYSTSALSKDIVRVLRAYETRYEEVKVMKCFQLMSN